MAARQDERVARVTHADDALAAVVLGVVVDGGLVQILVLDAVNLLQQVAQSVDEHLLLERAQHVSAVQVLVDHAYGGVRLAGF